MLSLRLPHSLDFFYRPTDLMRLFLSAVSRRVAVTLLSIFSPIFVFQVVRNLGVGQGEAIAAVFAYYFIAFFVRLLAYIYSENLSQIVGFKGMIRLSFIPFVLFLPALFFAARIPAMLSVAAVLWGIHAGFFWWGYHGYFVKSGEKGRYGEDIGKASVLETVALVVTPAFGAFVVSLFGFGTLFILSAIFMVFSLILLGKDHDKKQKIDIEFREVINLVKSHRSISLAYAGSGTEGVLYYIVWPLFLFLFFGQVISLGAVLSASALIAAVFGMITGRWDDKRGERTIISYGVPLITASWLLRILARSMSIFIIADSLWNFGQRMVGLPLNALTYNKAVEGSSARAILFRETAMLIGILISILLIIVWLLIGGGLMGSFLLAAIASTLPLIAVYKKRLHDTND